MKSARDALDAVADATAALNFAVAMQEDGAPMSTIAEPLKLLARAVARAEMVLTIEPDSPIDKPLAGTVFTEEDRLDRAVTIDALEAATALPSEPVLVQLHARPLGDGSLEDTIRRWIEGQYITAVPSGDHYAIDFNRFASNLGTQFLPPTD